MWGPPVGVRCESESPFCPEHIMFLCVLLAAARKLRAGHARELTSWSVTESCTCDTVTTVDQTSAREWSSGNAKSRKCDTVAPYNQNCTREWSSGTTKSRKRDTLATCDQNRTREWSSGSPRGRKCVTVGSGQTRLAKTWCVRPKRSRIARYLQVTAAAQTRTDHLGRVSGRRDSYSY